MHGQPHPDLEQLDRLRAGLLDGQPELKTALLQHLAQCQNCQEGSDWRSLQPGALGPELDTDSLRSSLRDARRRALQSGARRHSYGLVPYATAALLLIAVSVGVWTLTATDPAQQLASDGTGQVPDLYEDLDFYLWLANQKESENGNDGGNPNNT